MTPSHDERPWGDYTVLDEAADYKVKRINVIAGKRLSYQRHARRTVSGDNYYTGSRVVAGVQLQGGYTETIVIQRSSPTEPRTRESRGRVCGPYALRSAAGLGVSAWG